MTGQSFAVGDRVRIVGALVRHTGREGVVDKVLTTGRSCFVTLDKRPRERTVKRELVRFDSLEGAPPDPTDKSPLDHEREPDRNDEPAEPEISFLPDRRLQTMAQQVQQTPQEKSLTFVGSFDNEDNVNRMLARAAEQYHLVSPASAVGSLPEGCEIATSFVKVDARLDGRGKPLSSEVYDVGGGKLGLAKVALDKIAAASGISWDPIASRRLDDGSDPYYVEFRAVGTVRGFDGTPVTIVGTKEMDLRPASPQVEAINAKVAAKNAKYNGNASGENQIREMRLHILGHAESKARLRAIRSIGIRTSYEPKELERPFLVAKLVFTGRTEDPELRRQFAMMRASAMLGSVRALFGEAPPQVIEEAREPNRSARGRRPPPVGQSRDFDEDDAPPPAAAPAPRAAPAPAARPSPRPAAPAPEGDVFVVPFGRSKGQPVTEIDDENLEWLAKAFRSSVEDPDKARFRAANERGIAAIEAEMDRRSGVVPGDQEPQDDPTGGYGGRGDNPDQY